MLAKSIRTFAGRYSDSAITAVSPRPNRRPSEQTRSALERLNVNYLELNLESPVPEYGPSFKVFALAEVVQCSGCPILIQIDSDTLFCSEPELQLADSVAAARPIDLKGMCSTGVDDPMEIIWQQLARVADISLADFPTVEATVSQLQVRASYNGGLLVVRRQSGIYQLTAHLFSKIVEADIRPYRGTSMMIPSGAGWVTRSEFWGTAQVAFSLAVAKLRQRVSILSPDHNIPLHLNVTAPTRPRHLHYHGVFSLPGIACSISASQLIQRCSVDFQRWLSDQLPI
jgi:hypothetical protein